MIPDLLSMIEFLCLAVSGLMAAAVTLIAMRQTSGRDPGEFGARNGVSVCGSQNPFGPVCAHAGKAEAPRRCDGRNTDRANPQCATTLADAGFAGSNVRVLSHPVVILQGCGQTNQCRTWFVDEALPRLAARGYAVAAA